MSFNPPCELCLTADWLEPIETATHIVTIEHGCGRQERVPVCAGCAARAKRYRVAKGISLYAPLRVVDDSAQTVERVH